MNIYMYKYLVQNNANYKLWLIMKVNAMFLQVLTLGLYNVLG